jgi:hypothetical protein
MFGNIPRSIEYAVGWVADFIEFAVNNNIVAAEATEEGKQAWTKHVHECAVGLLANEVDSWVSLCAWRQCERRANVSCR